MRHVRGWPRCAADCAQPPPTCLTTGLLVVWTLLLVLALNCGRHVIGLTDCNFERYQSGCFSQANFECDIETNKCRCQALTPVLIDDRLCVKRAKALESCQYSVQCDNDNGYACYAWPPTSELIECRPPESRCRCLSDSFPSEDSQPADPEVPPSGRQQQAKASRTQKESYADLHWRQQQQFSYNSNAHDHRHQQQHKQQINRDEANRNNSSILSHYSLALLLSRFVWIFLVLVLIGLIVLLVLIKYQSFRTVERPFHRAEDQVSISSELDVPPPYEVAIRMEV